MRENRERAKQDRDRREKADEIDDEELRVVRRNAHRFREEKPVVPHLAVCRNDAVESDEGEDQRYLTHDGDEHRLRHSRVDSPSHCPYWRDDCDSDEKSHKQQCDPALAREILELPQCITAKVRLHQFFSPTASLNCCSRTDLEGTTLATRTPPAMIFESVSLRSLTFDMGISNSPPPTSFATGIISSILAAPLTTAIRYVPAVSAVWS